MKNIAIIKITGGNLRNDHFYLESVIEMFPVDSIGGPNDEHLGVAVEINCGISSPVLTDIAGDKKIFRKRKWVREFFLAHAIAEGDSVVIHRTAPRRFHIYPAHVGD